MDYVLTREYLKPSQREVFDKVFQKEAQKNFIKLCKKHLICPICGGELYTYKTTNTDSKIHRCKICGYTLQ